MKSRFTYKIVECPICGISVSDNWLLRHMKEKHPENEEMLPNDKYAVWWLTDKAIEMLQPILAQLPEYMQREVSSLWGRPKRGRLWVSQDMDFVGFSWIEDAPISESAEKCGGILIYKKDARLIAYWPGFVTDLKLNLLMG